MKYIIVLILLVTLSTCKKYPEGGLVGLRRLHLFGGHKKGDHKTWKLKLYEVNGIDSTQLIPGANSIPNYYDKFITFTLNGSSRASSFSATCFFYNFSGDFDNRFQELILGKEGRVTNEDTLQCYNINGSNYCCRNILIPEGPYNSPTWQIKKLKKTELIITIDLKHSYKIILAQ